MNVSTNFPFLIFGLVFIAFGVGFGILGLRKILIFYEYQKHSISQVETDTKAEISGYICEDYDLMRSPVTGTYCAYWEVYVYTTKSRPKGGSRRVTLLSLSSNQPLIISDGSDEILVPLDQVPHFLGILRLQLIEIARPAYFSDSQNLLFGFREQCTVEFLEKQNLNHHSILGMRRNLRVIEKVIVPRDKIFAWGTVEMWNDQKVLLPVLVSDQPRSSKMFLAMIKIFLSLVLISVGFGMFSGNFLFFSL